MAKKQQRAPGEPASAPELSDEMAQALAEHTKDDTDAKPKLLPAASTTALAESAPADDPKLDPDAAIEDLNQAYEDAETDAAVDEIMRSEGDAALAHEDAAHQPEPPKPRGFWGKIGHFFAAWWRNKWARWITILLLVSGLAVTFAFPTSRYFVLNAVGIRSSAQVRVVDIATQLPLKNAQVTIGSTKVITNEKGIARFERLKLGPQTLAIKRIAFAPVRQDMVIGWGSNPLGTFKLSATGIKYVIDTHDYLSNKGVANAQAESGQATAVADDKGIITLVLSDDDDSVTTVDITVAAGGYRTETFTADLLASESAPLVLVPAAPAVYLSKQSGKYDLIRSDIDGKNRKVLLAGSGTENNNVTMAVDADSKRAALVSTRDAVRDNDGYLLSTLTLVDLETGASQTLDHAEQIQLIDWVGTRLIYEQAVAGASASNSQRYRLIAYDYESNNRTQLAAANQFHAVMSAQGMIYYSISNTDPAAKPAFIRVKPDGTTRQTILAQETWSAFRTDYNTLALQTPTGWFAYTMSTNQAQKTNPPTVFQSRLYADQGSKHAWIDPRDAQSALLAYDATSGKDTLIHQQAGMGYPLRWLNGSTLLYRVATPQEVADYAVSINGGQPKKISDVVNSYGFAQAN